ncbi:unnamed protein product [Mortierella alpina]
MDSTASQQKAGSQEAPGSSQSSSSMMVSHVNDLSPQQAQPVASSPDLASRSSPTVPMASLSLVSRSLQVAIAPQGISDNTEVSQHKQTELRVDHSENVSSWAHTLAPDSSDLSIENRQAAAAPKHHQTRPTQAQEGFNDGTVGTGASMDAAQENQAVGDAPTTVAENDSTLSAPDLPVPMRGVSKESRSHYYDEYESHLHHPRRRRASRRTAAELYSLEDPAGQDPDRPHHASKTQRAVHAERVVSEGRSRDEHVSVYQTPPGPPLSSLSLYPPESDTHAHEAWRSPPSPHGDAHFLQVPSTHPAHHECPPVVREPLSTSRGEGLLPPLPLTPLTTSDLFRAHWSSRRQHSPAISLSPEDRSPHLLWQPPLPQEVDYNLAQTRRTYSSMPVPVQEHGGDAPLSFSPMDGSGVEHNAQSLVTPMQLIQPSPHANPLSTDRIGDQGPSRTFGADGLPSLAPRPHSAVVVSMAKETASSARGLQPIQYRPPHAGVTDGPKEHTTIAMREQSTTSGSNSNRSALRTYPAARITVKGPLPIDVQIKLLSNVLRHDPFNCPIRRTTQVWECIAKEQGMRARTCARRFDNIVQASIAGRERAIGTEEQIATKKQLLEQLLEMMNQPQAKVRMQKKRRYRSEKADRQLLLETIRFNPFAQKIGQVAKAWEDVRDALNMKVHSRQCIRRVNRIVKPYLLRERMYKGDIPEEMQEENDDLVKQVLQLMHQSGQTDSLEDEEGNSNDEESAISGGSETDDQDDPFMVTEAHHRRDPSQPKDSDKDSTMMTSSSTQIASGTLSPLRLTSDSPVSGTVSLTPTTMATSAPSSSSSSRQGRARRPRQGSPDSKKKRMSLDAPEPEFRPQRIWGSHPYSREVLSRSSSSSSRVAHATHVRSSSEHEPVLIRSPLAKSLQRPSLPSPTVSSISTAGPSHGALTSREGSVSLVGNEATTQVYRAILGEFQVVKRYFSQLDGQRQRDKDNQKALYTMMERMQQQMQQQQRSIEELQQHLLWRQARRAGDDQSLSASTSPEYERHQQVTPSVQGASSEAVPEAPPSEHD